MIEQTDDKVKKLERMADYLKGTLADQLAITRDSDSKVNLRLTICAGALGLITLGLPAIGRAHPPCVLLVLLVVALGAFGWCLLQSLLSALDVLKAQVKLPGIDRDSFRRVAVDEQVTSVMVLEQLVQNYADTVHENATILDGRKPLVDALRRWSEWTIKTGFLTVALFGIVFIAAWPNVRPATEKQCIMTDEVKKDQDSPAATPPAATPSVTPAATPATDDRPSLHTAPQTVDLTQKKPDKPILVDRVITKQQPEKKQE